MVDEHYTPPADPSADMPPSCGCLLGLGVAAVWAVAVALYLIFR